MPNKNLDEALATTLSMLLETDEADLATSKLLSIGINLVNLGADVNTIDSYGFSLFHHAVLSQSISASQSLIDLGADVNLQLETEINQQLLAEGKALLATIHQTSYSPLHLLATNNIDNIELITLLINNNANLNSMGLSGMNVVQAYYNHYDHHISVLELLIQHSDVNFRNLDGRTILHYVNEIELITMILDRGADVNAVDNYGRTALYYHSIGFDNHQAQINLLIQSGADLNIIDEDGHTPLRDDLNVLDPFEIINSINQIIPDVIIFMGVGILLNMEHNFADNFCG
jgi:ankyrin repeat protein